MMLSAEQSQLVRSQIADVLDISADKIVPAARLVADLGCTVELLKPIQLAIETALGVQIDPITDEINARTAMGEDGLLTEHSFIPARVFR